MQEKEFDDANLARIMSADVDKLNPLELKLRLKTLEANIKLNITANKVSVDKKNLKNLGPDDLVTITMIANPQGDIFNLNGTMYAPGQHVVKKRVAEYLQYMVSQSYKVERERLVSRSNPNQSSLLRGEDLARVERFEAIMKED